jgi:PAS domain S-box-containing protein
MKKYSFSDLVDVASLQRIADANYRATGMPVGIIDAIDGSILVGAGWQELCTHFHRKYPISGQRCRESDAFIFSHLKHDTPCAYKCKNGLWDIGIPIIVDKQHLATLFLGQFFYKDEIPDRDFFRSQASLFGFKEQDYLAALDKVPSFSREVVANIIEYDEGLAGFLAASAETVLRTYRAEAALQASLKKYSALIQTTDTGYVIVDMEGRVVDANEVYARLTGHRNLHEIIGRSVDEWTADYEKGRNLEEVRKCFKDGNVRNLEVDYVDSKGKITPIEINATVIDTADGLQILTLCRDISERRKSEQKIREQLEFIKTMMNAIPVPVYYKGRDGRYLGCNQAFLLFHGKQMEEIVGKTVYDIAPEEYARVADKKDLDLLAKGGNDQYESKSVNGLGLTRDILFYKTTFEGRDHYIEGIIGALLDITEYRMIEEKLRQSQKMEAIGQLAGGIAHDFNNMLGVIISYSELLKMQLAEGSSLAQYVEGIENAAMRSRDITRQLLAFSRKQIIAPKHLNANMAITETKKTLARLIGENIDLQIKPGPGLWCIRIDPAQFDQILINLAVNARDAMPSGGRMTIETANFSADETFCQRHADCTAGEYVRIIVNDNGSGMDLLTLAHIFEPFFTTKDTGKGTGLGLATVYGIVRQNEGFVTVESEPGKGSTFAIYLPRALAENDDKEHADAEVPQYSTSTILLVEDDNLLRMATKEILEAKGYRVLAASAAVEAIGVCSGEEHIDLLITDVVMPGMDGTELSRCIADLRPGLKVLFMSGYTSDTVVHHGVAEDELNFIQKPFNSRALLQKIRDITGSPDDKKPRV